MSCVGGGEGGLQRCTYLLNGNSLSKSHVFYLVECLYFRAASVAAMLDPANWHRPRHRIAVCFMTAAEEQRQSYETVFFFFVSLTFV